MQDGRTRSVLVVEDDAAVMAVLKEILSRAGYLVLGATHGPGAVVRLTDPEQAPPDAIILDVNLPVESGVSVLGLIRTVLGSSLPVIVLTGSASPEQEEELHHLGVSNYLRKPVSAEVLLSALSEALG